ncbi:uncharacterized protein LOC118741530 [Rhagoletis pomonella]|uniref:uncharacterized protein LOC118741530 n=1 Tax=Rhagoletis pomonella TaxID=28610 RepID=UPI00177D38D2|nr:uncharacterized protein LOC118741530 [Rhagoletis pomonella]
MAFSNRCKSLNLGINVEKTKFMCVNSNRFSSFSLYLDGKEVEQVRSLKWLGRVITASTSVNNQVSRLKRIAVPGKNLIKCLTPIKSGLVPKVALNFYKSFVRSKVEYANSTYADAPIGYNKKIQVILNDTLRRCLGLPPSAPVHVRYALAGELPPLKRAEWLAAKELSRQWLVNPRLRDDLMSGSVSKSSYCFVYEKHKAVFNLLGTDVSFCRHRNLHVELSELGTTKNNVSTVQLKSIFVSRLRELQNSGFYLLATDASVSDGRVGFAVHDPQKNVSFLYRVVGDFSSTLGELLAIRQAVRMMVKLECKKIAILSDSMAALRLINKKRTTNHIVAEIQNLMHNSKFESIKLSWVPSHVGLVYNEKADLAAKAAVRNGQDMHIKFTVEEGLRRIRQAIWREWESEFSDISQSKGKVFAENGGKTINYKHSIINGDCKNYCNPCGFSSW